MEPQLEPTRFRTWKEGESLRLGLGFFGAGKGDGGGALVQVGSGGWTPEPLGRGPLAIFFAATYLISCQGAPLNQNILIGPIPLLAPILPFRLD